MTKKAANVNRQAFGLSRAVIIHLSGEPPFVNSTLFKKNIALLLKSEGVGEGFLSFAFISDKAIRKLNRAFLKRNRRTDVLAFDYTAKPRGALIAGDAFISLDAARRVSKELRISFKEEVCRYIIHAILHLLGYDDGAPAKKKKMWKRQEEYIRKFLRMDDRRAKREKEK